MKGHVLSLQPSPPLLPIPKPPSVLPHHEPLRDRLGRQHLLSLRTRLQTRLRARLLPIAAAANASIAAAAAASSSSSSRVREHRRRCVLSSAAAPAATRRVTTVTTTGRLRLGGIHRVEARNAADRLRRRSCLACPSLASRRRFACHHLACRRWGC